MNRITTLLKTGHIAAASLLVFGLVRADAQAPHAVDHSQEYKAMSMKDDLAHRSPDIHWPTGFEPEKADLFAHNDLIINASCERVWRHIIEASRWPTWYPNSKDVEIQGGDPVLRDGTVFRWTTFGLAIESKVHEYVLNQRLGWYGYVPGAKPSFGHAAARTYGIRPPTHWFDEFLATYFEIAFVRQRRADLQFPVEIFFAINRNYPHPYTSLSDFESRYPLSNTSPTNYAWYQAMFEQRIEQVYSEQGIKFLREVREIFPADKPQTLSNSAVLEQLERICPGFIAWSRMLETTVPTQQ